MLQLIDDQTASNYYNEIDTATGDDLQSKTVALEAWANNKKAERTRQEWDHVSKVFTDFDNYSAAEGLNDFDEESRYQYANRKFIANQTGDTPENQMFIYPSKRDEVTDQMFGKTGLSEKEAFDLFKHSVESRNASEEALRELPGVLAQGVLKRAGEGKPFDEVDSWFAFSDWKDRHADKLASMPKGWETAMLDSAVKLHARTEQLMDDVAPESKRAMDTLMKFTRPEDAANLPEADRADVENLAKDFAKLTPEKRQGIYATLSYAAEANGAGMGKGFWEKVGEGMARGGGNIYDDAAMTAQDRQARQNISFFQDLIDKPQAEPDTMQTADSIQMQRDMAQKGLEENKQRLGELRVMREIRDLAQGRIDPIKTEMDGVLGQVVQGAYDFSQSAAYTGMAMVPYVGLPAVMGALANSNYLRMLDQYPDMDADAAFDLSLAIAGPQAIAERFQAGLLLGKLPFLGKAMKKLTDARVPLPARIGLGYGAVVGLETGTELVQEAMPIVADQLASAVREDMPEFDAGKAWGAYRDQAPKIFYSMLWGGLMGGGAVGIRELERSGVYMRNLQELEMHGITGEAAQNIAAEQDADQATTLYREAWDKRSPEDIQAGIAKRAAMLDAAQATQANPDLPTRRIKENPDGTLTHIIEQNGQAIYSTNDPAAADLALVNFTRMVDRGRITGTTNGIVEALSFFNQVNEAANRGDDVQKFILENTPRNLLDEYEANPTEQNLDNLFKTVRTIGQDISEPAELANFPVLASNQGALAEGIFKSVIRIYEGATGDKVVRDVAQDNLKRAIAEQRITMDWVRENLNQIIPQIDSERITQKLRTETDTDVIESFSDVALAYMRGNVREEQIPAGLRGFLRRMAIVVKDIFRRAYKLKRLVAEGKVDANFESLLADSVGLNQQARVDTASSRVANELTQGLFNYSIGSMPKDQRAAEQSGQPSRGGSDAEAWAIENGWPLFPILRNETGMERNARIREYSYSILPKDDRSQGVLQNALINLSNASQQGADNKWVIQNFKNAKRDLDAISIRLGTKKDKGGFRLLEKNTQTPYGSRYYNFDYKGQWWSVRVADHANTADRQGFDDFSLSRARSASGMQFPHRLNIVLDQKSTSDKNSLALAKQAVATALEKYNLTNEDAGTYNWLTASLNGESLEFKNDFDLDELLTTQKESQSRAENSPDMLSSGQDRLASSETGETNPTPLARPVNPNSPAPSPGATNYSSEEKYNQIVPEISSVNPSKVSRRDMYEVAKVSPDVAANMSFEKPIEVSLFADGTLMLSDGHHRLAAAKQLGMNSIPAVVRSINAKGKHINALIAEQQPGATNYSIGKKKSAGGIRFDKITKQNPKHDASRVGTAWQGKVKPTTQDTNDGIATINSKELEKQMAMLTHFVDGVPLPEFITKFQNPEERMRAFIDFQKENLLALYDAFDALSHDYVIRSTHWYDGARLLAEGVRDLYGLTIEQSSAVIAVFSPMKDWFQNVAMGQRFADVMANHKNTQISKATVGDAMSEMLTAAENESDLRKAFKKIKGRSISQLLADKTEEGRKVTAVAVRLMSTHVHGLTHDVLSPEGESLGIRKNLNGTNKKLVWQSYTFIEKAISIYEDGSAKNISKVLGTEHKIRNFYNNIVAPTSPYGDATVDTHAVNAAVLFPMGNKGYLVNLNFGGAGVAGGGNSGTYWLFHEALREAAAARKVMPRQMQSITWEAIRGLFTDVKKRDKNFVANIAKIWQSSQDANSARTQIIKLGITPPEWARVGSANSGIQGGVGKNAGQNANSAGSVQSGVRQGRKGGNGSGGVNYSIASQSEIDRVNRALGGMNRGPDERLKVYERAREKFSLLQAWNRDELQAMQETGADDTTIRRSQILQGLGELDAILSILPPEVRGRVGGYTKLASIAPHDVFKDGVKVSEVSGMNGAIISAWMREGQNIGQAGKQVSLPPGYEAKENLATARADKAIADFFRDRIKKIDAEFEKVVASEYRSAILDLVKKSRPKAGDNNVRKSTLGAETQKLADMVQRASLMDEDATAERMLQLEQTMATSENSADMVEEWGILNQFGDLKNRNSETLAQAYGWFKDQLQMGREAWRIKEEARIAENRERAKKTVEFIGGATAVDRFKDKTFMDRVSDWANSALLDHANFEQFVMALFPSDVAADFSTRLRKADVAAQKAEIDQRESILNALREGAKAAGTTTGKAMEMLKTEVPSAVRYLDGRKVKNNKLTIEQAEKIVRGEIDRSDLTDTDVRNLSDELAALPADTRKENITLKQVVYPGKEVRLPMTRGKAIQLLLSWNQPDVQDKMRREGWNDDSIVDLRELTSDPVSQAMIAHAQELYGKGFGITNPVYARMFGMNMPQVKNYAPTRFLNAKDTKDIGLDGSPISTGTTPAFAKSRVSHSAKIAPEDALSVMQQHILMQAHWVNFAELAREYRSLLNNPEVRDAIKARHGSGVLKTAEQWADQMEQRGGNQAREAKWVTDIIGSVIGGQSVASLGFNLKSIAMQLDNALRFGLALDTKQIASAMSSPDQLINDIKTVFESDALQTRLRGGATAETRYMFERFGGRPGTAANVTELSMKPMNWMDVSSFSYSAAIVYRANLNEALEAGMPESLARETALDAAAAAIYRFAQPVSFGQKSNVENSGNMFTKAFFLFMSDPRLKAAIMADAVRGLATGRGDKWTHIRRLVAVELMAVLSHVVASSYRDAFTDDEDDDIWSYGGWVRAIALAPVQGYLFIGTMLDSVLSQLTGAGFFTPTQNPLLTVSQTGIRALKNADDILAFDDPDALFKEWSVIARTMAVAPAAAMPAVLLNIVKPIFGAASNATSDE